MQQSLGVPVGLISSNIGGTTAERWTSKEVLAGNDVLKDMSAPQGASDLWNAMIAPLTKFPIRGAIWYQGEAKCRQGLAIPHAAAGHDQMLARCLGTRRFPLPGRPIGTVRNNQPVTKEPVESDWAELREAQLFTSQTVPKVGLAVITDLGDEKDIHPPRKREVGERLALAAKAIAFAQNVVYSGPIYEKQTISGDKIILNFKHVGSGLVAKDGDLQGFTIAGEDKKFVNATARIEGDTVVVSSDKVPNPVAVRYGWANFPVVNLWNKEGLPASPFRTDDFPAITKEAK